MKFFKGLFIALPISILMWLMIISVAWATDYYIDQSCTTGGTGISQTCDGADGPFKTIAAAQAAVTGDQHGNNLLIKRGTPAPVYREQFTVGAYGTVVGQFTVGAYGSGVNPIINGSSVIASAWSLYTSGYTLKQDLAATPNDYNPFAHTAGKWIATSFIASSNYTLTKVSADLEIHDSAPFSSAVHCYIYTDNAGSPGTSLGEASATIQPTLTSSYVYYDWLFTGISLIDTTTYWVVLAVTTADNTNIARWGANYSASGETKISAAGTTWAETSASQSTVKLYADATGNIYQTTNATTSNSLWQNNIHLTKMANVASIIGAGQWASDGTYVYVWATDSADPTTKIMEVGNLTDLIIGSSKDYFTVQDLTLEKGDGGTGYGLIKLDSCNYIDLSRLTVRYGGYQTYGIRLTSSTYVTTEYSTIHDILNTGLYYRDNSTYGSIKYNTIYNIGRYAEAGDNAAITIGTTSVGAGYATIEYNTIYNIGVSDSVNSHNQALVIDRSPSCVLRYNLIHDTIKGGIMVSGDTGANHINGVQIYYNIIYNINSGLVAHLGQGGGIQIWDTDNATVYNNVIWNIGTTNYDRHCLIIEGDAGETLDNIVVKDNIIGPSLSGTPGYRGNYSVCQTASITNWVSNNNLFYDTGGLVLRKAADTYTTLATWQAAVTPQDANSINSDPLFVSTVTPDFHLQSGSPAINAGVDVGLTQDYEGKSVPTIPSIGAYQSQSNYERLRMGDCDCD
jgi:hypothetical protein